jgi:hypothetical protein
MQVLRLFIFLGVRLLASSKTSLLVRETSSPNTAFTFDSTGICLLQGRRVERLRFRLVGVAR